MKNQLLMQAALILEIWIKPLYLMHQIVMIQMEISIFTVGILEMERVRFLLKNQNISIDTLVSMR